MDIGSVGESSCDTGVVVCTGVSSVCICNGVYVVVGDSVCGGVDEANEVFDTGTGGV